MAIKSEMNSSGQHLVANLRQLARQLIDRKGSVNFRLTLRWSAGHEGITLQEMKTRTKKLRQQQTESSDKKDFPVPQERNWLWSLGVASSLE